MNFKYGDRVRWVVDVDKVYSEYTKTKVGTIGILVPPKNRAWICENKGNLPDTCDVDFDGFVVWNIPYSDMEKV